MPESKYETVRWSSKAEICRHTYQSDWSSLRGYLLFFIWREPKLPVDLIFDEKENISAEDEFDTDYVKSVSETMEGTRKAAHENISKKTTTQIK